jgi:hypothetical protein
LDGKNQVCGKNFCQATRKQKLYGKQTKQLEAEWKSNSSLTEEEEEEGEGRELKI